MWPFDWESGPETNEPQVFAGGAISRAGIFERGANIIGAIQAGGFMNFRPGVSMSGKIQLGSVFAAEAGVSSSTGFAPGPNSPQIVNEHSATIGVSVMGNPIGAEASLVRTTEIPSKKSELSGKVEAWTPDWLPTTEEGKTSITLGTPLGDVTVGFDLNAAKAAFDALQSGNVFSSTTSPGLEAIAAKTVDKIEIFADGSVRVTTKKSESGSTGNSGNATSKDGPEVKKKKKKGQK